MVFQNLKEEHVLNLNKEIVSTINSPRSDNDYLMSMRLRMNKVNVIYERKYDKLQGILAETGGIMKLLLIFFAIFTKPIVQFKFYRDLSEEYFDFDFEHQPKKKEKLNLGVFQYFCSFFKAKDDHWRKKRILFEKAKEILNLEMSLCRILKKTLDIEKLKFLLFDDNQIILFDDIPKPVISNSAKSDKNVNLSKGDRRLSKWNEHFLQQSLKLPKTVVNFNERVLMLQSKKSQIDIKILELTTDFAHVFTHEIKKAIDSNPQKYKTDPLTESQACLISASPRKSKTEIFSEKNACSIINSLCTTDKIN